MDSYPPGFEECDSLRSAFIRDITLRQIQHSLTAGTPAQGPDTIPKNLIRYWPDPAALPEDVSICIESWDRLADEGFQLYTFDDVSAAEYISKTYGETASKAFARCNHPAMRCDYLRMCFVLAEGGLYVDADDVLLGDEWRRIFQDGRLKVQPLCYDITAGGMLESSEIWNADLPTDGRVFYINNDPIAAPANHPVLRSALDRATGKLLDDERFPEIQSTTGPGNLTIALAAHARQLESANQPYDFELMSYWDSVAAMRWDLSYRGDARNWRNVFGC